MATGGFTKRSTMRILLSDPSLVEDLRDFLQRCNCDVQLRGETMVEASPPERNVEPAYLRMELDAYLRVWRLMHPGADASIAA
jgi:hypothetical protein